MLRWLKHLLSGNVDGDKTTHYHYQRKSLRCVSCGEKILKFSSAKVRECMIEWDTGSVTFGGGIISCGNCNVNHSNYCVHGRLRSDSCTYCPDGERIATLGELRNR